MNQRVGSADEDIHRLLFQVTTMSSFWFGLVAGDDRPGRAALRERLLAEARANGLAVRLLEPQARDLADLHEELRAGSRWDLQWVVADGPGATPARWDEGAEALLLALNRCRESLRRSLRGGLVLEGGDRLKRSLRSVAPDLFSIRAVLVDLGANPRPPGPRPPFPDPEPERWDTVELPAPQEADVELARARALGRVQGPDAARRRLAALLCAAKALVARGDGPGVDAALDEAWAALRDLPAGEGQDTLRFKLHTLAARQALGRGQPALAEEIGQRALSLTLAHQPLWDGQGSAGWRWRLRRAHDLLGDIALDLGDLGRARVHREAGLAAAVALWRSEPGQSAWQRAVAISENRLGDIALRAERLAEARHWYESSARLRVELADSAPTRADLRRDLAIAADKEGDVAWEQADLGGAEHAWRRALELRQELAREAEVDPRVLRELAWSHGRIAEMEARSGFLQYALREEEAGVAVLRGLLHDQPDDAVSLESLADGLLALADRRSQMDDDSGATDAAAEAVLLREGLLALDPDSATLRTRLACALEYAVEVDAIDPSQGLRRASNLRRNVVRCSEPSACTLRDDQLDLAASLEALARVHRERGALGEARRVLTEALSVRAAAAGRVPDGQERADLAEGLLELAEISEEVGDADPGDQIDAAIAWLDAPGVPSRRSRLAEALCNRGDLALRQGDQEGARRGWQRALASLEGMGEGEDVEGLRSELERRLAR